MADKQSSGAKRQQTVRERSQLDTDKPKVRRVQKTAHQVGKPVKALRSGLKGVTKPLKPVAKPFQTKPVRKIGRVIAAVLLINYFRSSWRELRQVSWPDRKSTFKLTIAVFVFAIIFGAIVASADYGLDKLFHKILLS